MKRADLEALAVEARDLMGDPDDWESIQGIDVSYIWKLIPSTPVEARALFFDRYHELLDLVHEEALMRISREALR